MANLKKQSVRNLVILVLVALAVLWFWKNRQATQEHGGTAVKEHGGTAAKEHGGQ